MRESLFPIFVTMEEAQRAPRASARKAAAAGAAFCCCAAVVVLIASEPARVRGARRDELSDASHTSVFLREAEGLRRTHQAYDRAKERLARMSTEYTTLGVRLEASERRAAELRGELESKMRAIRSAMVHTAHDRPAPELGGQLQGKASIMSLADVPSSMLRDAPRVGGERDTRVEGLAREVRSLQTTIHRMAAVERWQGESLAQLEQEVAVRAATSPAVASAGVVVDPVERVLSAEHLASLAQLSHVDQQLRDENEHICALCSKSALLRASRVQTCGICAPHGDGAGESAAGADEGGQPVPAANLAGAAIGQFVAGWRPAVLAGVRGGGAIGPVEEQRRVSTLNIPEMVFGSRAKGGERETQQLVRTPVGT